MKTPVGAEGFRRVGDGFRLDEARVGLGRRGRFFTLAILARTPGAPWPAVGA
jgi:hypothetical protein